MRVFMLVFLLLFTVSCGGKKKNPVLPTVISQELTDEINRITPLLYWCDDQASGSGSNNVDHRPHCDVGDAAAESGFLTLVGQFQNESAIFAAMAKSFGPDNQPFRAPSYVGKDGSDEFSRDQLLGFIQATVAGLPSSNLEKILDYYNKTGALCPHPSDNRCWISPGLMTLAKLTLGRSVTAAEKAEAAVEINLEAATVPANYQSDLVVKRIFTMIKLNKLTTSYVKAMDKVYKKAPNNLWFRTVYKITHKGKPEDFAAIAKDLTACMKTWQTPGTDWTYSKGDTACYQGVYGHELVALGHLLLNEQPDIQIENDEN